MINSADPDQKPTDLDLHCLQKQDISGFSRTLVNYMLLDFLFNIIFVVQRTCLKYPRRYQAVYEGR